MVVKDLIMAIKMSLENLDMEYCTLMQIDYSKIASDSLREDLATKKYLERPFVYEFHHQIRKLIDDGEVDFGGPIVQAEIDKGHQHCFENGKIPDFIINIPNINRNLGVIEFRLASNPRRIEYDLEKLAEFRRELGYAYVIEAIIGNTASLKEVKKRLTQLSKPEGEKIMIVEFDIDSWRVVAGMIGYVDNHHLTSL